MPRFVASRHLFMGLCTMRYTTEKIHDVSRWSTRLLDDRRSSTHDESPDTLLLHDTSARVDFTSITIPYHILFQFRLMYDTCLVIVYQSTTQNTLLAFRHLLRVVCFATPGNESHEGPTLHHDRDSDYVELELIYMSAICLPRLR